MTFHDSYRVKLSKDGSYFIEGYDGRAWISVGGPYENGIKAIADAQELAYNRDKSAQKITEAIIWVENDTAEEASKLTDPTLEVAPVRKLKL